MTIRASLLSFLANSLDSNIPIVDIWTEEIDFFLYVFSFPPFFLFLLLFNSYEIWWMNQEKRRKTYAQNKTLIKKQKHKHKATTIKMVYLFLCLFFFYSDFILLIVSFSLFLSCFFFLLFGFLSFIYHKREWAAMEEDSHCYCGGPSYGLMVCCSCCDRWFHEIW